MYLIEGGAVGRRALACVEQGHACKEHWVVACRKGRGGAMRKVKVAKPAHVASEA